MADTGKQSPLGINVLGAMLQNCGLNINRDAERHMGKSKSNSQYDFGIIVQNTLLRLLTWSIHDAYNRGQVTESVYNRLIDITGFGKIHALGNAKPPTYSVTDTAGVWTDIASRDLGRRGPANTGYAIEGNTDHGQSASWLPYNMFNPNNSITQWGYIRLHALQAWNEFNFNGDPPTRPHPEYKEFLGSYMSASGWVDSINEAVLAVHNSEKFLENLYTDINDLVTGDISGVSNSLPTFGRNLELLGDAIDLSLLSTFGLPSTLLRTLSNNNAITEELSIALLSTGLSQRLINNIISGTETATVEQERSIRGAFLLIRGENLRDVLSALNSSRTDFESLADLLDIKKLFSISDAYRSLTVPVYSTNLSQPAKTYYPIYSGENINNALRNNIVREAVGNLTPSGKPPIVEEFESSPSRYKELPVGFDSYLRDILPADQALAAGAFSYSMRQIKNIENMALPEFANIVQNLELVNTLGDSGLNLGTNLSPVDDNARIGAKTPLAQGSGPYNTYTMSDMFGSMSGLPYAWSSILSLIEKLAPNNSRLYFIYQQLFLAVTWEPSTFSVNQNNSWITTQEYVAPQRINNENNPYHGLDPSHPGYDPVPYVNNTKDPSDTPSFEEIIDEGEDPTEYDLFDIVSVVDNGDGTETVTYVGTEPFVGERTQSEQRYSTSGQPRISSGRYRLNALASTGGGYGRGGAPNPQVTRLLRDPSNPGPCAGGTYTPGPNTNQPLNPEDWQEGAVEQLMSVSLPRAPTASVGRADSTARSLGRGSFGRLAWTFPGSTSQIWVTNVVQSNWEDKIGQDTLNNPEPSPVGPPRSSAWVESHMPLITFSVQHPPVAELPVGTRRPATTGTNTPGVIYSRRGVCRNQITDAPVQPEGQRGWPNDPVPESNFSFSNPPMNSVVGSYILQANEEISNIHDSATGDRLRDRNNLIIHWNQLGRGLTREQRTRYTALGRVDIPKDYFANPYPSTQIGFVDSVPGYALDTRPHMNAQTIENICDFSTADTASSFVAPTGPGAVLGDFIKLQITPGGDLEGVLPVNVDIVFVDVVEREPIQPGQTSLGTLRAPGGLAAGLAGTVIEGNLVFGTTNPALLSLEVIEQLEALRVPRRDQFSYTTLVVNYGGATWVTAQQLVSVLNSVDGIDAELLPGGNPDTIFTPETLIGYQGNLAGIEGPIIDYASRPSLSDFGWTRRGGTSCAVQGTGPTSGCFFMGPGDSPSGENFFRAKVTPEDLIGTEFEGLPPARWWQQAGMPIRTALLGGLPGSNPNQDNRQYISFELPTGPVGITASLPKALEGNWVFSGEAQFAFPENFIWTISEKEGDFDPIQAPGGYGHGRVLDNRIYWQGPNSASRGFRFFPNKTYYLNMVATSSLPGTPTSELQPEQATSTRGFLFTQRGGDGRTRPAGDVWRIGSAPIGDPNAPIGNFGPVPVNISIETVREPSVVLDNFIRLQATPGGNLEGVPPANVDIVFINTTESGPRPAGLAAGLDFFGTTNPNFDINNTPNLVRDQFSYTTLVVNYGGATKVTAQQLVNVLNGVDGIDAELLPERDPNKIFTPETLIGNQGNLAGIREPVINYSNRPSLSDFGWTRATTCLPPGNLPGSTFPGHGCFFWVAGDNPDSDSAIYRPGVGGSSSPGGDRWFNAGGLPRILVILDPGQIPDNRRYISLELDTTGMPTTRAGGFQLESQPAVFGPNNIIWTISEKEGDFDPIQAPGGYSNRLNINQARWRGQDATRFGGGLSASGFKMRPNTKYYLNIVATDSPIGTPVSDIQPEPVRGLVGHLFAPASGDFADVLRNKRRVSLTGTIRPPWFGDPNAPIGRFD